MNVPTSSTPSMLCPVCRVALSMSERQGVEIDFCPQCRGVWLDRGELDKIIERSESAAPSRSDVGPRPRHEQPDYDYGGHGRSGHHGHKRRRGFLSDLFD
ncbi:MULTISPECIES: zf-TFIIB domain-containing protein [Sphingomonadaceae]